MGKDYEVTGQHYTTKMEPDGTVEPVVEIAFTTTTSPPVSGSVSVPQSLLKDKARYAETVKAAIDEAVGGHQAVAIL